MHIAVRSNLDQVIDSENSGVPKHINQIADSMYEWEGDVAEKLLLSPAGIAAIKTMYPNDLRLQTYVIIPKSITFTLQFSLLL